MNELTKPLDREEMAMYMTHLTNTNFETAEMFKQYCGTMMTTFSDNMIELAKAFENSIGKMCEKLVEKTEQNNRKNLSAMAMNNEVMLEKQNEIAKAIVDAAEMSRKQIFAITKNNSVVKTEIKQNPLFYSTMNNNDQLLWIEKVRGEIAKICLEEGKNKGTLYKDVYAAMKQDRYDVDELLKEYKDTNPKADTLTMIAASDALQHSFEKCINSCVHRKIVRTLKNPKFTYERPAIKTGKKMAYTDELKCCPENVLNIIRKLSKGNRVHGRLYSKAYNLLGIDTQKLVEDTCERLNVSQVSIGYAIGINPTLVSKLNDAVNEYLKKEGK